METAVPENRYRCGSALCLGCLSACSPPIYDEPDDSMFGEATLNREDLPFWPTPGEAVAVDIPSQYWSLLIIRLESDTWCGVWRVCTHGACEVEWQSSTGLVRCPCHGSEFTVDDGVPKVDQRLAHSRSSTSLNPAKPWLSAASANAGLFLRCI